jgi:PLP dependent protein
MLSFSEMSTVAENLINIRKSIRCAAEKAGRNPEAVTLVAVGKTHSPETIREAIEAGHFVFGENRVQEAKAKIALLPASARWHFIGHLQGNKIRQALPLFEMIESVHSLEIARDINRIAGELGLFPRVLIEVNVAGEGTKFGLKPESLEREMDELLALDRLEIRGLMAIPPFVQEAEDARPYFRALREIRDGVQEKFRVPLPELSMGMSGDFPAAIEEGATIVRVGTAIFGERRGKTWRPPADVLD